MITDCKTIIAGGCSGVARLDQDIINMLDKYLKNKIEQGHKIIVRTLDTILIGIVKGH